MYSNGVNDIILFVLPSALFLGVFAVALITSLQSEIFLGKHGRLHRCLGLGYLLLLAAGFIDVIGYSSAYTTFTFHCAIGISGIFLTLSASWSFDHKHVENPASGTLDSHTLVTNNEMVEHAFYQALNLLQVLFLHALDGVPLPEALRLPSVLFVQSIWLLRSRFPVNRFSDNYKQNDPQSSSVIRLLYRLKKWQYVFLKHALIFGLNVGVALRRDYFNVGRFALSPSFRLYWLLLNASFVFEFFLQTLVRRHLLTHQDMLRLQMLQMLSASLAVIRVLGSVHIGAAAASVLLNFIHRKHDFMNSCGVVIVMLVIAGSLPLHISDK